MNFLWLQIPIIHEIYGGLEIPDVLFPVEIVDAAEQDVHHILHGNVGGKLGDAVPQIFLAADAQSRVV